MFNCSAATLTSNSFQAGPLARTSADNHLVYERGKLVELRPAPIVNDNLNSVILELRHRCRHRRLDEADELCKLLATELLHFAAELRFHLGSDFIAYGC